MNLQSEIDRVFSLQADHFQKMRNTTAEQRIERLERLQQNILQNQNKLEQALYEDLKKTSHETGLSELYPVISEIKHVRKHLSEWMRPKRLKNPLVFFGSKAHVRYEPKGLVLILSPWNYPFQLALGPVVSAVAAGNCVILKPSEISAATSRFIAQLIKQTFPAEEVTVLEGDQTIATALLEKPFHHVFFTGSPAVGKIVMQAAAKHLASVTLELGGKSPAIVDANYDLEDAARKVMWGKLLNAGQTCVAPDYVLVPEKLQKQFIDLAIANSQKFYGRAEASGDYCKIISAKHLLRLRNLLDDAVQHGAKIETGGEFDESKNYFAPTILSTLAPESEILHQEIFGPVLPVVTYKEIGDALEFVNSRPRPLASYIFSNNSSFIENFLNHTHSGGVCVNDVAVHFVNVELPFGGSNNSGIGNSHGYFGFRAFSHERAVLKQPKRGAITFFYPPYTDRMKKLIEWTVKYL